MSEHAETIHNSPTTNVTIYDFEVLPQKTECPNCRIKISAVFLPDRVCSRCAGVWLDVPDDSEADLTTNVTPLVSEQVRVDDPKSVI